jgi:hypothetical protein
VPVAEGRQSASAMAHRSAHRGSGFRPRRAGLSSGRGARERRLPLGSEPTRAASLPDSGYAKSGTTLFDAMH